jgi:glycosyltransferase involved in cell wall biosynthesis
VNPRVSICTSVLDQSEFLKRMIASVQAQTMPDWELVLVDDGSTEDIKGLIEQINDRRIVYVRFPENKGIPHGLNHAFTLATGDYVQPLSADEFITADKLEVQVAFLDAHPEIGCVWGLPGKGEMGLRPSWEQYTRRAHNRSREAWIRTLMTLDDIPIGGASMLMRKPIMDDLKGFDPQFFHCSDLELFVRFFQKHEGWIMPYRFADADQPETRLTAPSEKNAKRFRADMKRLHKKHKLMLPPMTGRVTVGIPVYNMAKFVGATLDSLKAQTVKDFNLMILDDASTDDLATALAPYADMGIQLLRFDENRGVRHAVNQMIARCETEFYVSLAADDTIEPTFLERVLAEFKSDPWLEFVASQTDFMDEEGKILPPGSNVLQTIVKASNKPRTVWLEQLKDGNHYFGVGMYRTSALRQIAGLNVDDGVLTDYDLYLRLLHRENIKIVEEPLTHTRIHEGMSSFGPGKIDPIWLKAKYHEIKSRYFAPRQKVIIATPFYEMRGFSPYISSLTETVRLLCKFGIDHEFWELSGDSYVDRAKNTLFNKFLEDPSATDLFMIDSDMQWNPIGFLNMLSFPEEIVMGSYPQKNAWTVWTARPLLKEENGREHPVGRMLPDGSALIKAQYLAGGFIRIKRSCLEKYREAYGEEYNYYDAGADPGKPDRKYIEFFTCERRKNDLGNNLRWGEDRVFGLRMADIGIEGWIYPNVDFGHYGVKGWMGNFDRFLKDPTQQAA